MAPIKLERRTITQGSIICDNGVTRLRVIRDGYTLALALDARCDDDSYATIISAPLGDAGNVEGEASPRLQYVSFEPLDIRGVTSGVELHGVVGKSRVMLTAILDAEGNCCHLRTSVTPVAPIDSTLLIHRWQLSPDCSAADLYWPNDAIYDRAVIENPAIFFQLGPVFAGLIPDLEEGTDTHIGLRFIDANHLGFEYGPFGPELAASAISEPICFAYTVYFDAQAIPMRGHQQLVRVLGTHDALKYAQISMPSCAAGHFAALPPAPPAEEWTPFVREGTPEEIAALTRDLLIQADDDWQVLETALCWLDRLCLQQHLAEIPGSQPFGSFANGKAWTIPAQWMPMLLLKGYAVTGVLEYGYRAMAAIEALPPKTRAAVLKTLRPEFGDILIDADSGDCFLLSPLRLFHPSFSHEAINLTLEAPEYTQTRLVVRGSQDAYALTVNGERLGVFPAHVLAAGIVLS